MGTSIKDIAKLAGVSITTVSRVMNNSKPVSDELRERVNKAIAETQFTPNALARSLVNKKTKLIGVIIPKISNTYFSNLMEGIEEVATLNGYNIIISSSNSDTAKEVEFLNIFKDRQIDGIIFCVTEFTKFHRRFYERSPIPTVFVGQNVEEMAYPSLNIDNEQAAYELVNYVIQEGHKEIAYIRGSKRDKSTGQERYKGFVRAMEQAGLPIHEEWTCHTEHHTVVNGYNSAKQIMSEGKKPTAICASSDLLAAGVINYLQDNGYEVPSDISVTGFDDAEVATLVRPKITTSRQNPFAIGRKAMELVLAQLQQGGEVQVQVIMPHKLVVRDSVAKENSDAKRGNQ